MMLPDDARWPDNCSEREPDRGPIEAFREDASDEGTVEILDPGCCRILLKPDTPVPCSCSAMAFLEVMSESCSASLHPLHQSEINIPLDTLYEIIWTDLIMASKSGPAMPASKEKRIFDLSDAREYVLSAPVLRFFGNLISE